MNPSQSPKSTNGADIGAHAQSIVSRGFTVIPAQLGAREIGLLNLAADRALDKVSRALAAGSKPAHTTLNPFVHAARCFYTWDPYACHLLGHQTVHELAHAVLGRARLWDMVVLEALPMPSDATLGPFDWHRDFSVPSPDFRQGYLWVFICLTDVTEDNGATWVVPGSHHDLSLSLPPRTSVSEPMPSGAVQLTARAGDMVAMNPTMLHCVGWNRTQCGRRLALVGLCRSDHAPLLNHWSIAGTALRDTVPDRVRRLLFTSDCTVAESWDVLPDGWMVAKANGVKRAFRRLFHRAGVAMSDPIRIWRRLRRVVSR